MCPVHHIGRSPKRSGDRLKIVTYRVKSFLWLEKTGEGPYSGFGFAADLSEQGAGLYLDRRIQRGASVRVAFEEPDAAVTFWGVVAWCQRYTMEQRFQGHPSLDHRVGISFRFSSEPDRQRYLMFYNDLRKRASSVASDFKF